MPASYDADAKPNDDWTTLSDDDRIQAILDYHEQEDVHPLGPQPRQHAAFHNIIELQIARDDTVGEVCDRLVDEGLTRHNAIHAMASVLAKAIEAAKEKGEPIDEPAYVEELQALSAQSWRQRTG